VLELAGIEDGNGSSNEEISSARLTIVGGNFLDVA
jgi:hypothetical protein